MKMREYIEKIKLPSLKPGLETINHIVSNIYKSHTKETKKHKNYDSVGKAESWASMPDCLMVYLMVNYYKPKVVLEIGTYSGTITHIIVNGNESVEKVYTCDKNNVFHNRVPSIVKYTNSLSTPFLKSLIKKGVKIDFCFVDANLQGGLKDAKLIKKLFGDNRVVFSTHDYAPGQKGVTNIDKMINVLGGSDRRFEVITPDKYKVGYDVDGIKINSSVAVIEEVV